MRKFVTSPGNKSYEAPFNPSKNLFPAAWSSSKVTRKRSAAWFWVLQGSWEALILGRALPSAIVNSPPSSASPTNKRGISPKARNGRLFVPTVAKGSGSEATVGFIVGLHGPELGPPGGVSPCQPGCVTPVPGSVRTTVPSTALIYARGDRLLLLKSIYDEPEPQDSTQLAVLVHFEEYLPQEMDKHLPFALK
jgi:hypothetical protein